MGEIRIELRNFRERLDGELHVLRESNSKLITCFKCACLRSAL